MLREVGSLGEDMEPLSAEVSTTFLEEMSAYQVTLQWVNKARFGMHRIGSAHRLVCNQVPVGIYASYKSTPQKEKLWTVLRVMQFQNRGPYVVYCVRQYGPQKGKGLLMPLVGDDSFLLPVNIERPDCCYAGPRFRHIRELTPSEALAYFDTP